MVEHPESRRRWFQFGLQKMFVYVTAFAIVFAMGAWAFRRQKERHQNALQEGEQLILEHAAKNATTPVTRWPSQPETELPGS